VRTIFDINEFLLSTRSINIQCMYMYIVGKVKMYVYELRKHVEKRDFEALFWSITKEPRTVFDPFICTQNHTIVG